MSLANKVLDLSDDVFGTVLSQLSSVMPPVVKTAQVLTAEERSKLHADKFALIIHTKEGGELRKFPVHDETNTWLSAQYFAKTSEQLPQAARVIAATNLVRACAAHGVDIPEQVKIAANMDGTIRVNRYKESEGNMNKTASVKTVVAENTDKSEHFYALGDRYPMPNAEFVKKAAEYFETYAEQFPDARERNEFAHNVIERARELKCDIPTNTKLNKYAGSVYGDAVRAHLRVRAENAHAPEMRSAYEKLAQKMDDVDPRTFANTLYELDKLSGLNRKYNHVADPYVSTYGNLMAKQAGAYRWESRDGSVSVTGDKLSKLASGKFDRIKGYFGETLAKSLKDHPVEIFDSLPDDAKETIVRIGQGEV